MRARKSVAALLAAGTLTACGSSETGPLPPNFPTSEIATTTTTPAPDSLTDLGIVVARQILSKPSHRELPLPQELQMSIISATVRVNNGEYDFLAAVQQTGSAPDPTTVGSFTIEMFTESATGEKNEIFYLGAPDIRHDDTVETYGVPTDAQLNTEKVARMVRYTLGAAACGMPVAAIDPAALPTLRADCK